MKIVWAGQACFQISANPAKDVFANIVIDPFGEIGLKMPNFEADILLVTHGHEDHNNVKAVKPARAGEGSPFIIEGPGEYEIKGVFIKGINSFHDDKEGKERGANTIYTIETEGMKLCHLGDLGQSQLTDAQLEEIGTVDILMIPVGGVYTIDSAQAPKIIGQIEPKMAIPMHYELPKLKFKLESVDRFLKAMGKNSIEPADKL
ncbi:MAG: MBL fold metallo-hydrolase, partial [Patescibacteria group bacterium]